MSGKFWMVPGTQHLLTLDVSSLVKLDLQGIAMYGLL